jgi:type IV pilus assembly protein PilB
MKIGEFLIENNYVTQEEVNAALELQKRNRGQYIGEILIKMNVITEEQLTKYVCEYDTKIVKKMHG